MTETQTLNKEQRRNVEAAHPTARPALIAKYTARNADKTARRARRDKNRPIGSLVDTYRPRTTVTYGPGTGRGGQIKPLQTQGTLLQQLRRDGRRKAA
jgi:hypothetical protein